MTGVTMSAVKFDPQKAERYAGWLQGWAEVPDDECYLDQTMLGSAAAMLRAAAESLAAAEKVIKAAREVTPWRNEHRVAKQLTYAEATSLTVLAQALQEYDRG